LGLRAFPGGPVLVEVMECSALFLVLRESDEVLLRNFAGSCRYDSVGDGSEEDVASAVLDSPGIEEEAAVELMLSSRVV